MSVLELSAKRAAEREKIAEVLRLAGSLTGKLLEDEVISSEEAEIVKYGLENIGSNLLGLLVILAIGGCFRHLLDSFLLWLLIFPLRKNAGGFHAKTKTRCMLVSAGMLIVSFICLVWIEWTKATYILIAAIFLGIIFFMAPVGNQNKLLDEMEQKVYRKRTRIVLFLESMLLILACVFDWKELLMVITMCFSIVGMTILAGKIKLWLR